MIPDDCEIPASTNVSGVWTHVWIAETAAAAREKKRSGWVDLMIPQSLYLADEAHSVKFLIGHDVRFCDVHGWPKNTALEESLILRLQSRGCTLCKQRSPRKMQCQKCATFENVVQFNIREKKCIDCLTEEVLVLREEVRERRDVAAELGGANSCVSDERQARLFLKHRRVAQELQRKWVEKTKPEEEQPCERCGDKGYVVRKGFMNLVPCSCGAPIDFDEEPTEEESC